MEPSTKTCAAREFVGFWCAGECVGWLRPPFAGALCQWPRYFVIGSDRVELREALDTRERRTAALDECTRALADAGLVTGWRDERYAIRSTRSGAGLFDIERAAMHRFGLMAHGANLNGYVDHGDCVRIWIARRSITKPIDPGLLDTLVGGGIGSGYTPRETLVKEAREEAGVPRDLAAQSAVAGMLRSCREVPDGLHREIVHAYDLALPATFVPVNRDGEVAAFHLVPASDVRGLLDRGEFCAEAALVTRDFMQRRGLLERET